ncbi:hypothetical protein Slin15195_G117620 [Septoria linicola]|uniref:Uncharacterized protein n=1 Tax=Septoria linicola TaxID=215465 RepID=A0A9Q9ERD1_9PEZI|nr:hypothetical protein Slin15195_G117620 [Septoria linicola]
MAGKHRIYLVPLYLKHLVSVMRLFFPQLLPLFALLISVQGASHIKRADSPLLRSDSLAIRNEPVVPSRDVTCEIGDTTPRRRNIPTLDHNDSISRRAPAKKAPLDNPKSDTEPAYFDFIQSFVDEPTL